MNTEIYGVNLRIQSEYMKIWARKNSIFGRFSHSVFWVFGRVGKRLDKKTKVNSEICDVTNWIINIYNTHIARYLNK